MFPPSACLPVDVFAQCFMTFCWSAQPHRCGLGPPMRVHENASGLEFYCIRLLMHRDQTKCIEKEPAVEARWGGDELQPASPRRAGSGGAAPRHRAAFVRVIIPDSQPLLVELLFSWVAKTLAPPFIAAAKL